MNRYFLDDQKAPLKKLIWQIFFVFFFVYEVQPFGVPDMLTSRKIVFYSVLIQRPLMMLILKGHQKN